MKPHRYKKANSHSFQDHHTLQKGHQTFKSLCTSMELHYHVDACHYIRLRTEENCHVVSRYPTCAIMLIVLKLNTSYSKACEKTTTESGACIPQFAEGTLMGPTIFWNSRFTQNSTRLTNRSFQDHQIFQREINLGKLCAYDYNEVYPRNKIGVSIRVCLLLSRPFASTLIWTE